MNLLHISRNRMLLGGLCLTFTLFQGCAPHPVRSDFLGENTPLQADTCDRSLLWWEKPDFSWHDYAQVMVDPVAVKTATSLKHSRVKPQELQALAEDLRRTMVEQLPPDYPVVKKPGPNVLRIRCALTYVDTANPALNLISAAALFVPLDMGGAAIEVEFLDSLTGERLAAMADAKSGTPLQLKKSFQRLGHTHYAFDQWVQELKWALAHNP